MSSSDGSLGSTGSSYSLSNMPYTWILTPLIVFLALGIIATLVQFQRRRRLRKLGLQRPWPRRDLEANRQRGQRSSRNGRWAWTTRSDEGLDEFGEAPPAYEPKAKPGQAYAREGSFEMAHHVEHTARGAMPPPPPIGGTAGVGRGSLPPDYGTATGSTSSSTPPPAVTSPPTAMTRQ